MRSIWRVLILGFIVAGLALSPNTSSAQFGKLKKKVKDKVEKKVDDKVDEKIDETLEGKDEEAGEEKSETADESTGGTSEKPAGTATAANKMKPGEGAWANYDFVPGDRVLYFEDFERCPVGDFPERLEFESGNMETIEWEGGKYLRMPTNSDFNIPLPEVLPDRFTLEFNLYLPSGLLKIHVPRADNSGRSGHSYVQIGHSSGGVHGSGGGEAYTDVGDKAFKEIVHCRIMGYGKYLKVYLNETRVANVPNADFGRGNKIHINLYNFSQDKVLIDNIRVAEGGKKILYEALMADGRVATHGIYFDSGSDRIRPESTPTLKQIGRMLQDHADLSLMIEGHTDDQGEDAYNMDLSDRRAAAVKAYIVKAYEIDDSRMRTKGFGESKPAAPNTSPEGRQNNRRVELVKL